MLRGELDPAQSPGDIIRWHARRYFTHLPAEEVEAIALSFAPPASSSLAAANREAERLLYVAARAGGWHKLTLRERRRLRLSEESAWVRDSVYAAAQVAFGSPTGCGEATLRAAAGDLDGEGPELSEAQIRRLGLED